VYCESLVKRHEKEQYICAMLGPESTWAATMALRAFNIETGLVKDSTSNPTTGAIRLQWWRDAIEALYTGNETLDLVKQPVVAMLYILLRRYYLPKEFFVDIINARQDDLNSEGPDGIEALLRYAEQTQGSLVDLALHTIALLDADYPVAQRAARHAGKFVGLTTLLRATPFLAKRNLAYVPSCLLSEVGVSSEEFIAACISNQLSPPMKACLRELVLAAEAELAAARELQKHLVRDVRLILLSTIPSQEYIKRLKKNDFEIGHPKVIEPTGFDPLFLRLRLRMAAFRGTF